MYRAIVLLLILCIIPLSLQAAEPEIDASLNWPQWRGPLGTGAAPTGNPPIKWNEQQNIRWKTRLSGTGYGTPVIWENSIFVSSAILPAASLPSAGSKLPSDPVKFIVTAIDRTSGKTLWERTAREAIPHQRVHSSSTWSAGSPITDGKHVYAFFGSFGIYCYTMDGDLVWEKDLGDMDIRAQFGEGSTPALYKDRLIVLWDHEGQSFITALDSATGEELWKKNRDEGTTWVTPLIVEVGDRVQVITGGTNRVRTYDLETGDIIWEDEGLTANVIPTPVTVDGIAYITSGHRGSALRAVKLSEAKGTITGTPAILWSYNQDTPYVPSPLLQGGLLYFLKSNNGILTCVNIATGQPHYANQRLEGIKSIYASPVGSTDSVYILGREGVTMVVKHGPEFSVLATNKLDDNFDASPVIVGNDIFLRGHQYLYCIGE
ncbi:PQQ-binding-like beta-propeller repeat protein [Candidatus Latescibacterota bacterium]